MLKPVYLVTLSTLLGFAAVGCERETEGLAPFPFDTSPEVFVDDFAEGVDYQAFLGSKVDAVDILEGSSFAAAGSATLKVTVPPPGAPSGTYAGGAFTTRSERDLSGYNALTFWARSSVPSTLDVAGFGNDNSGTSEFEAKWDAIPLTTTWQKLVIPIPLPERLGAGEGGLFYFAEGAESESGHDIYFDEVRFDTVPNISNPRPSMQARTSTAFVGSTVEVTNTLVVFDVGGADQIVQHLPGYFSFVSSDAAVATVEDGIIRVIGPGMATISAKLGAIDVEGEVTIDATTPPTDAAPTPTFADDDVISLFSNVYSNTSIDTWSADWDRADPSDLRVDGDDVKAYTNLVFAGIEFGSNTLDVSAMTHFHIDLFLPTTAIFKVKLVDFGPDGTFGGAPDAEHELTFTAASTPAISNGAWVTLDIPLENFTRLITREHMAQLILSADGSTAFVDNIFFHK